MYASRVMHVILYVNTGMHLQHQTGKCRWKVRCTQEHNLQPEKKTLSVSLYLYRWRNKFS